MIVKVTGLNSLKRVNTMNFYMVVSQQSKLNNFRSESVIFNAPLRTFVGSI